MENDTRAIQQNNMSILEFYYAMSNLWDQLALIESVELQSFKPYTNWRKEQCLVQFLMAFWDDFEGLHGRYCIVIPFPSVYSVVNEFLVEETWLESQIEKGNIVKEILSTPNQYVYAVHSNKGKSRGRNCYDECSFCKQKGHWKAQCPKLLNKWQPPQRKSPN